MTVKKHRRNPQDATLRNVRAANTKIAQLTARVAELERKLTVRIAEDFSNLVESVTLIVDTQLDKKFNTLLHPPAPPSVEGEELGTKLSEEDAEKQRQAEQGQLQTELARD